MKKKVNKKNISLIKKLNYMILFLIAVILVFGIIFIIQNFKPKLNLAPEECPYATKWDGTKCKILVAFDTCRVAEGFYDVDKEIAGECFYDVKHTSLSIQDLSRSKPECVRYACALNLAQQKGLISASNKEKLCMREITDFNIQYDGLMDCVDLKNAYGLNGRINMREATLAVRDLKNSIDYDNSELYANVMKSEFKPYFKNQFKFGDLYRISQIKSFPNIPGAWVQAEFEFENPSSNFLPSTVSDDGILIYYMRFFPKDSRRIDSGYNIIFMTEKYPTNFKEDLGKTMFTGNSVYDVCNIIDGKVEDLSCYNDVFDENGCFSSAYCDVFGMDPDCDDYAHSFCKKALSRGMNCKQLIADFELGTYRRLYAESKEIIIDKNKFHPYHALNLVELRNPDRYCVVEPQDFGREIVWDGGLKGCWLKTEGTILSDEARNGIITWVMRVYPGTDYILNTFKTEIKPGTFTGYVKEDIPTDCNNIIKCVTNDVSAINCARNFRIREWCELLKGNAQCSNFDSIIDTFCSNVDPLIYPLPGWNVGTPTGNYDYETWGVCGTFDGGWSSPMNTA